MAFRAPGRQEGLLVLCVMLKRQNCSFEQRVGAICLMWRPPCRSHAVGDSLLACLEVSAVAPQCHVDDRFRGLPRSWPAGYGA